MSSALIFAHCSSVTWRGTYWTRSLMGPIVGFGPDTRKKDWDFELLRKLYRQVRQVQPCYLGDYWPLTPYRKDANGWCAYQFDLPDAGRGIVAGVGLAERFAKPHARLPGKRRPSE